MPALTELEKQAARPLTMGTRSIIAWLEGAKTQTRRLVRPQPLNPRWYLRQQAYDGRWAWWTRLRDGRGCWAANVRQPYAVGDLRWIREGLQRNGDVTTYQADGIFVHNYEMEPIGIEWVLWPWKRTSRQRPDRLSAMFMPRWACRHYGRVISRRPEWLQDITDEDAVAEGTLVGLDLPTTWYEGKSRNLYLGWWDSMHYKPGTRSEDNPTIWRYKLEKIDAS